MPDDKKKEKQSSFLEEFLKSIEGKILRFSHQLKKSKEESVIEKKPVETEESNK